MQVIRTSSPSSNGCRRRRIAPGAPFVRLAARPRRAPTGATGTLVDAGAPRPARAGGRCACRTRRSDALHEAAVAAGVAAAERARGARAGRGASRNSASRRARRTPACPVGLRGRPADAARVPVRAARATRCRGRRRASSTTFVQPARRERQGIVEAHEVVAAGEVESPVDACTGRGRPRCGRARSPRCCGGSTRGSGRWRAARRSRWRGRRPRTGSRGLAQACRVSRSAAAPCWAKTTMLAVLTRTSRPCRR